jgi:hypothetical protein
MNRDDFSSCLLLLGFTCGAHHEVGHNKVGKVYHWQCSFTANPISVYFFTSGNVSGYTGNAGRVRDTVREARIRVEAGDDCSGAYQQIVAFQLKCLTSLRRNL